ncbi:MAG: HDOD domain-containing protein [Gammaproteobacteria bacterium]|jgi:signal transduction histidine kinase/HD-like signal output (HDOD) protein|nr:HDOD domain-containing protein [Gammaproteobacteria bacterium]
MEQIVKPDSSRKRMRDKAQQLLQEIEVERLPPRPNIVLPLLRAGNDFPSSREQLAEHIDKDPALHLRLHSVCRHYGCDYDPGASSAQRLQQLDQHTIKSLIITSASQQYFTTRCHQADHQQQTRFLKRHWQHSLLCASLAKAIARHSRYQYPEEAYTAGLLHDIGQLVLHCAYPDIYATLTTSDEDDLELHDLENNEFACDHLYLGAELLRLQNANSFLCDAILYHHQPLDQLMDTHPLVKIINFANRLSNTDLNIPKGSPHNVIFDHADQLFGFNRSTVIEILSEANEHLNNCALELEIDLDDGDSDKVSSRLIQARIEQTQAQLDEQIKLIGLLDGLHQHLSRVNDDAELFTTIEQYTHLLFGIEYNITFLYDVGDKKICAMAPADRHLADLEIPLLPDRSIVTDCLLEKQPLHCFSHSYNKLSLIDQQLLSAGAKQGMICLPLLNHHEIIGVLSLAVDRQQQMTLWKQLPLLSHFSREIAQTIYARHSRQTMAAAGSIDYEAHIREVIHEVGNPLSIINNYLEILSLKLDDENQAHTDITTIKSEIYRVSEILQRLKAPSSSTRSGVVTKVDVNKLLTELTQFFKISIPASSDIELKLELDPKLRAINCNANAIKQIYTNLIKNATEALTENTQIMVYTHDQVNVDGKTYIEISVVDNGPGIRPEVLNRLFKPVQTDKGDGHAGIGLSIVKKLVDEINGSISCRSNNQGTAFQILIPDK